MISPREGSPRRRRSGRLALWAGLAVGGMLPSIGCQVEYAGMTLPSGKYMHDDVQYFAPGPDFPWANTQAATQRARMSAMGEAYGLPPMPAAPGIGPIVSPPPVPGAISPLQNIPGRPTDVNASPFSVNPPSLPPGAPPGPGGVAPVPGDVPAPGSEPGLPPGGPTTPDPR
jgi:hypothetical protein